MDVAWAHNGETVVWVEGRGARGVVVAQRGDEAPRDISGDVNARGGVGYGGGELAVHENVVFFAGRDGRIYRVDIEHGQPRPITPGYGSVASPTPSPDGRWVVFVHSDGSTDLLAAVDAQGKQWPWKIVVGADFYMQPTWSPDGSELAWIAWDQPNMPWDGTRLERAPVAYDRRGFRLGDIEVVAGDEDVAVQQPEFSPDGKYLAYISDEFDFNHLWVRDLQSDDSLRLSRGDADIGGPAWIQGLRHYAWSLESRRIFAARNERGVIQLTRYTTDGTQAPVEAADQYTQVAQPTVSPKGDIAFIGSSSTIPSRIVTLVDGDTPRVAQRSDNERVPPSHLSAMRPVSWMIRSEGEETEVFGNFYPPTNPRFEAGGRPPAIVRIHGGPTSQRTAKYDAQAQFFATRGFAVLDVNYRGSTGYGRTYMELLRGQWGVLDVEDAIGAARFLVDADLADPDKLVIMGGSAGGYTVLQALCDYPGSFAAGVCLYGIANLFTLASSTHKFEASYNDTLLGPLPEASEIFRERSPIFKAEKISDPVAIYHGQKDKAVPPDQAEAIVESLRARGVPHYFHMYEDEGHGFRRPENLEHFYDSLTDFLTQYVLFG
jgi:dipeptidyl aminopeptidase/acylaminoacyl peptidase